MTTQAKIGAAVPYLHLVERIKFEESDWPAAGSITIGVALRAEDRALAERLRDVIERGDAFQSVEVKKDVSGKTYMSAFNRFSVVELAEDLDMLDRIGPLAGNDPQLDKPVN